MSIVFFVICSYLMGSIPSAYIISKFKGIDITKHGSGNPGATNITRVLGIPYGIFTLFCDIFKGYIICYLVKDIFKLSEIVLGICIVTVILGHMFSIFLKFKGGKGVAVFSGVVLGLEPLVFGIFILTFLFVFLIFKYVSISSLISVASVCVVFYALNQPFFLILIMNIIFLLILFRHRDNLIRFFKGKELKIR